MKPNRPIVCLPFLLISILVFQSCSGGGSGSSTPPNGPYAVNVAVTGLWSTGGGLILTNNTSDVLPVNANGIFQFPTEVSSGGTYSVAVQTQPASPSQNCTVTAGTGTVAKQAVSVTVDCGHAEWAWMGGSSQYDQPGVYGTVNTPSANNIPGARMSTVTWIDKRGTLWMFGGVGIDSVANGLGQLSDLWTFSNGQWTWVGGSTTVDQAGVYGQLGSAATGNWPGARGDAVGWIDSQGTLWLFGGFGFDSTGTRGFLNDLWKYSGGQWTWVGGSQTCNHAGAYGSKGSPSANNIPGGRMDSSVWTGTDGSFWLYGGAGFDSTDQNGWMTDLWKYSNGEWTWVQGADVWGKDAVYGAKGTADGANTPGARSGEATWTDSSGNLWLFGGINSVSGAFLSDVWEFSNGEWTWQNGTSAELAGVYGTQGLFNATNAPGGRLWPVAWQDVSGNVWIFGGFGLDSTDQTYNFLSDVWEYSGGQWAWQAGPMISAQPAVFGTQGQPAPGNVPGPRYEFAAWVDSNQNFWILGGYYSPDPYSTYYYNDVWKLLP